MSRTNRYPGPCAKCGAQVAAEAGTLVGPPWQTICAACLPRHAAASAVIQISLSGDQALIKPLGFLGGDRFAAYKGACDRFAGYRKAVNGYLAELAVVPGLIEALTALGFAVRAENDLQAALADRGRQARLALAGADLRADQVDAELRKRGLGLYPFQREGVRWLAPRVAGLLADDMGCGKTIQALAAAPAGAPILVICPAVAKGVWRREAAKWRPDLQVTVLAGRGSFRWPASGITITNYDVLPLAADLPVAPDGVTLIVDEAHSIKGPKTARTLRVRAISKAVRAGGGNVYLLTATPMLNRPPELWSVLSAAGLEAEAFGGNWFRFAHEMGGRQVEIRARGGKRVKIWEWEGTPSASSAEALKRVMLRRTKDEVLPDLPALTYQHVDVEIDDDLRDDCDDLWGRIKDDFDDAFEGRRTSGIPFEEISALRARLAAAKAEHVEAMVEEYEEAGEPLVVFSCHRAPIEALAKRPGWAAILGGVDNDERTRIEERFQRGELRGVAATIKAGGVAITLTRASHAIFVDQDWTPALNDQARDRIRRIGTTKPVLIKILVADHELDRRVAELLARKREIIGASVEAARVREGESVPNAADQADAALAALAALAASEGAIRAAVEAEIESDRMAARVAADLAAGRAQAELDAADGDAAARLARRKGGGEYVGGNGNGEPKAAVRRGPVTPREAWAATALATLAACDSDHAFADNGLGFSKADQIGHALAAKAAGAGLTDNEWALATLISYRYPKQVGRPPENNSAASNVSDPKAPEGAKEVSDVRE